MYSIYYTVLVTCITCICCIYRSDNTRNSAQQRWSCSNHLSSTCHVFRARSFTELLFWRCTNNCWKSRALVYNKNRNRTRKAYLVSDTTRRTYDTSNTGGSAVLYPQHWTGPSLRRIRVLVVQALFCTKCHVYDTVNRTRGIASGYRSTSTQRFKPMIQVYEILIEH